MNCTEAQEEMAALLYGELDEHNLRTIEEHIDQCDECRNELASLRKTMQVMDEWKAPTTESASIASAIQRTVIARHVGFRRAMHIVRGHPIASGLAASIVLLLGLLLANTEINLGAGRLTIAMGRSAPVQPRLLSDQDRSALEREISEQTLILLSAMEQRLDAIDESQDMRDQALVRALQRLRSEDLAHIQQIIGSVALDAAEESWRNTQAIRSVVRLVAGDDPFFLPAVFATDEELQP